MAWQGGIPGCIDDRSATLLTITKFNSISMSFWCSDRASTAMAALAPPLALADNLSHWRVHAPHQ